MIATGRYRDDSRIFRFSDGRRFVLPLARRGATRWSRLSGYPVGWGIGGLVGCDLDVSVVEAVTSNLATESAISIHIRPNPLQAKHWRDAATPAMRSVPRKAHVVDLRGSVDDVWQRFRKSGRRGVKKAQKAGVDVRVYTGGEMLDVYYQQLYLPSVVRWAAGQNEPLQLAMFRARRTDPLAKLQAIGRILGRRFRLYLGYLGQAPVAGAIVLGGPNAHATRGALDYTPANASSAAYAVEWASISDACADGARWYQLGESGGNESLSQYKERFGAVAVEYSEYRIERLPLYALEMAARGIVKRAIGFREP